MKSIKQYNLGVYNGGITVEMASDGMIHIPSFMKIGSGIQVTLY
jgi:hypothetical protein